MLGVMLGLRAACQRADLRRVGIWLGALMVYPVLMLLLGGFLSYGSAAIILVCSALTVSTRSHWRVVSWHRCLWILEFEHFRDLLSAPRKHPGPSVGRKTSRGANR